ncbi:SurA N-terminal domain-containing protein [Wolbachia endosymbiont of Pentidionis agamae]|uniref:SurA N-terminal domain-containing protein n=1 Tax=Wolbachia endosymbiont of Pentidionis agamae TaxID=3110435 RepID=UPI002FD3A451
MRSIFLALFLLLLPVSSFPISVKIIAHVNNTPISNVDVAKRTKLITLLFSNSDHVEHEALKQLIDEIIILDEAKKLTIKLNTKELNDTVDEIFMKGLGVKKDKISNYISQNNLDYATLVKYVKSQLLRNKIIETRIVPFINVTSKEISDAKRRIERINSLITIQEFFIPTKNYELAEEIVDKLNKNLSIEDINKKYSFTIKINDVTVNQNHLNDEVKKALVDIGSISKPIASNEGYTVTKIIDKTQIDYFLLESKLMLKQFISNDSKDIDTLKKEQINCKNFNSVAKKLRLPAIKEFEVRMQDLNPKLQISLSKLNIDEVIDMQEGTVSKLIMLCEIKKGNTEEEIKQKIFNQKVITQANIFFDKLYRNAIIIN